MIPRHWDQIEPAMKLPSFQPGRGDFPGHGARTGNSHTLAVLQRWRRQAGETKAIGVPKTECGREKSLTAKAWGSAEGHFDYSSGSYQHMRGKTPLLREESSEIIRGTHTCIHTGVGIVCLPDSPTGKHHNS